MKKINSKRLFIWSLLLLCPFLTTKAQFNFVTSGYHDYTYKPQNLGVAPQSADFQRYGNIPVNHYNGLLDLEIPLEGYSDRDFDLPMSLKYISNGFIPSKRPSIAGMNWVLNFGGVITRTIKGSADDTRGNYVKDNRKYIKDGLLVAMRNGTYVKYTEAQLTSFDMAKNSSYHMSGDIKHDYEPDIFHFNFGNHHGKFFIGKDGYPVCLLGDGYRVDISKLAIQSYSTTVAPIASAITITTPDGYIYEFGGDKSYLEYNIPNNPDKAAVNPRTIISWYLKSIKSPNNRQVLFTYDSRLLPNHYNYYLYAYKNTVGSTSGNTPFGGNEEETAKIEVKDQVYTPILKDVTIDKTIISFYISPRVAFFDVNDPTYCISNISFKHDGTTQKTFYFTYQTKGKYIFLTELSLSGKYYNFTYHDFTPPNPLTTSVDHWGYWKGGNTTDVTNIKQHCERIEMNRAPTAAYAESALLKTITYPTGGTSTISYEKNTYTTHFNKMENTVLDAKSQYDVYCGGSRVRRIFEGITARQFRYVIPGSNKSSGIIFTQPKYKNTESFMAVGTVYPNVGVWYVCNTLDISSNSLGQRSNNGEYHIGYSHVGEYFPNGHKLYEYTSHLDISDSMEGFTSKAYNIYSNSYFPFPIIQKSGLDIASDLSHFRGKLKKQTTYDGSGKLVQTIENGYNTAAAKSTYTTAVASAYRGFSSYRIYNTPCLLTSTKTVDESGVTTTENYTYDGRYFMTKQSGINSDGLNYSTSIQYTLEGRLAPEPHMQMFLKNILNKPYYIRKVVADSIVDYTLFEYKLINNLAVVGKIKRMNSNTPQQEKNFDISTLVDREVYHVYDKYGNPVHISKEDGTELVILWACGGKYPLAKIELITDNYATVEAAVKSAFNVASISNLVDQNYTTVDRLTRKKLQDALPRSLVTVYTYVPFVGITSMTDPAGKHYYYLYDVYERLKEIYTIINGQKEVIEIYDYNYANT